MSPQPFSEPSQTFATAAMPPRTRTIATHTRARTRSLKNTRAMTATARHGEVLDEERESDREQLDRRRVRELKERHAEDPEEGELADLLPRQAEGAAVEREEREPREDGRTEGAELRHLHRIEGPRP